MGRPLKGDEPLDQRFQMMISQSELEAIDDWMFRNRIRGRAEAIRQLCAISLAVDAACRIKPPAQEAA